MVKKKSTRKTASRAKTRTVYVNAPRKRRAKSGYDKIPSAMATVGLVAVNFDGLKKVYNYVTTSSPQGGVIKGVQNFLFTNGAGAKTARSALISKDALIKDGIAIAGGYIGGEVVKKYAPTVIKKPVGLLAKKIPKVI